MPKFTYPKKPKAPKKSASVAVHQKYAERMKDYERKCKEVDKRKAEHAKAVKRTEQLKQKSYR